MLIKKVKIPFKTIATIGLLPSFIKKVIYRAKGYKIGKNVSIGFGSVIIGKKIMIEDHVKIGLLTIIRGEEILIERYATIGSFTVIDTGKVRIGEDARINEQVIIGGMKTPQSSFDMGKRTIVMEYSFINTTMPVTIGDDSGIGGHCLLFTHGSWLNQLDGFPVTFAPITLGKKVWLPWRVFIMPGVTIGDEVVIGANSLISSNLPSNVLAAGSPAKILKENYPPKITEEKRLEIINLIFNEFVTYLEYNQIKTERKNIKEGAILFVKKKKKDYCLVYLNEMPDKDILPKKIDSLVIDTKNENSIAAAMILNLQTKTRIGSTALGEEFAKYLSRHGIRLDRLD